MSRHWPPNNYHSNNRISIVYGNTEFTTLRWSMVPVVRCNKIARIAKSYWLNF
jgi:hypothetical protein